MKKLVLISFILCIALIGCVSAVDNATSATTTAAATTAAPQMIGGDKGAYLINSNVDGANVTFDNDFEGVITNGQLKVEVYTTGTPFRVVTVAKSGYDTAKVNITSYPAKGETVVMNITLVKTAQATAAATAPATAAVTGTAPAVITTTASVPAATAEVTTVVTTAAPATPSPAPTKSGSLPVAVFAAFGLIGILSIRSRR